VSVLRITIFKARFEAEVTCPDFLESFGRQLRDAIILHVRIVVNFKE